MELVKDLTDSITFPTPSFLISGAESEGSNIPRWDRLNSKNLIRDARSIYYDHLANTSKAKVPFGVVLNVSNRTGRVVFTKPVLLPNENFLSLEHITTKRFHHRRLRRPLRSTQ